LRQGITTKEVISHLKQNGFFFNRIAYPDPGQILSMRRLDDAHPCFQYHLRLFVDGELRGHYEYTPEDRPLAHMNEDVREARTEEFLKVVASLLPTL
jgi:hypothetical protein